MKGKKKEGKCHIAEKKTTQAEESPSTSLQEKETCWLRRAVSPLHHKASRQNEQMGIWREGRKGKGYIGVPAYVGSLAAAKKVLSCSE
eukprot:1160013-Pelagomonas_calceolata.AAC.9